MADAKYLPPEPPPPQIPGGRTRPSLEVDLADFPSVRRRRELNDRLLGGTCAVDGQAPRFGADDLDLLLMMSKERFGEASALLRGLAVRALSGVLGDESIRRLTDLAVCPAEHDGIRIAALGALGTERAPDLLDVLVDDPSPAVRAYARRLRGDERPERRPRPGQPPLDGQPAGHTRCRCC